MVVYSLLSLILKGGLGSGNWGHMGRLATHERGGSVSTGNVAGAGMSLSSGPDSAKRRAKAQALAAKLRKQKKTTVGAFQGVYSHNNLNGKKSSDKGKAKKEETKNAPVEKRLRKSKLDVSHLSEAEYEDARSRFRLSRNEVDGEFSQGYGKHAMDYAVALSRYRDDKTGMYIDSDIAVYIYKHGKTRDYYISASIKDKDGNTVGTVSRTFKPETEEVHHDYLKINDEYRNNGFGMRMYFEQEQFYRQRGIKKVTMQANLDVGCYTWARAGYKVDSPVALRQLNDAYNQHRISKGLPKTEGDMSVLSISTDSHPNSKTVGKDFLISFSENRRSTHFYDNGYDDETTGYMATKDLTDTSSDEYKSSLEYYKYKGINIYE